MNPKEGSQEYYLINRDKINLNDIETYKYFPIGERMRKSYDYEYQTLNEFLERYYSDYEYTEQIVHWQRWMKDTIMPLFNDDLNGWARISDHDKKHIEMESRFKNWGNKMREFYDKIKDSKQFDKDILLFISYIFAFKSFKDISYEDWINSKNYDIGFRKQDDDKYSLLEISKYEYGMNLIKNKLMKLDLHNS